MAFEYKVVPAPTKGLKAKGVRSNDDRFANALETKMNALAVEGWEYQRTDTLPSEEREGLMGKTTVYRNMLVFRRPQVASEENEVTAADPDSEDKKMLPPPLVPVPGDVTANDDPPLTGTDTSPEPSENGSEEGTSEEEVDDGDGAEADPKA